MQPAVLCQTPENERGLIDIDKQICGPCGAKVGPARLARPTRSEMKRPITALSAAYLDCHTMLLLPYTKAF